MWQQATKENKRWSCRCSRRKEEKFWRKLLEFEAAVLAEIFQRSPKRRNRIVVWASNVVTRRRRKNKIEIFSKHRKRRKTLEDRTVDTSEKIRGSVRRYAGSQRKIGMTRHKNLVDWTADEVRWKMKIGLPECQKLRELAVRQVRRSDFRWTVEKLVVLIAETSDW